MQSCPLSILTFCLAYALSTIKWSRIGKGGVEGSSLSTDCCALFQSGMTRHQLSSLSLLQRNRTG